MQGIATRGTREPIVFEALKPHQAFDPKQAEHFIALPAQTEHTVPTLQTFLRKVPCNSAIKRLIISLILRNRRINSRPY